MCKILSYLNTKLMVDFSLCKQKTYKRFNRKTTQHLTPFSKLSANPMAVRKIPLQLLSAAISWQRRVLQLQEIFGSKHTTVLKLEQSDADLSSYGAVLSHGTVYFSVSKTLCINKVFVSKTTLTAPFIIEHAEKVSHTTQFLYKRTS